MRLITAHRLLIGVGIAFFVFYALVELRAYLRTDAVWALAQALGSAAVAVGFVLYYRRLRRRWGP